MISPSSTSSYQSYLTDLICRDYLKRDDQLLALRKAVEEQRERLATILRNRDREAALANGFGTADSNDVRSQDGRPKGEDGETDSEGATAVPGSDTIVIHLGSQNMRIGVASDALPKTVPMVIAKKWHECEAEEGDASPSPKRRKVEFSEKNRPEKLFGSDFNQRMIGASADFKTRMRNNKLRLMPNSKELVISYNKKVRPDIIHEHNDAGRIIFTEYQDPEEGKPIATFTGSAALRIPDYSEPRYKLFWPIRQGWLNEKDYDSRRIILADIVHIIEQTLKQELRIGARDCRRYSCVFVIPDLYERQYVVNLIDLLLRDISFSRVSVIQESLAATFGAGYAQACVIDIGAAKTSVCCVDEGMCIEPSRMNLKYGGADVTSTLMKMLLYDYFPYDEINLKRRYDWLLAEELKKKICTMSEPEITVQLFDFHLRAFGQDTRKYSFKTYEEVILAQLVCLPDLFPQRSWFSDL